jgi:hypothetical protein
MTAIRAWRLRWLVITRDNATSSRTEFSWARLPNASLALFPRPKNLPILFGLMCLHRR